MNQKLIFLKIQFTYNTNITVRYGVPKCINNYIINV